MAADPIVARELKSLQDTLATTPREGVATGTPPASPPPASSPEPANATPEDRELRDQLHELVGEVTGFFEEAEKSVAAHPAQSMVGALLVGILIGRLLGRR